MPQAQQEALASAGLLVLNEGARRPCCSACTSAATAASLNTTVHVVNIVVVLASVHVFRGGQEQYDAPRGGQAPYGAPRGGQEQYNAPRSGQEQYGAPPRRPTASAIVTPEPRRAYSSRGGGSAPTVVSARSHSTRDRMPQQQQQRRRNEYAEDVDGSQYNDDVYDMYSGDRRGDTSAQSRRGPGSVRRGPSHRSVPSSSRGKGDDDEYYASDAYEGSSFDDEEEFEMLDSRSVRSGASRRAPEVKNVQ